MSERYAVVIGDMIGSRGLEGRSAIQETLRALLARISAGRGDLASPFTLTLGDEFQAVYRQGDRVFHDAVDITAALHPVRLRLAVGVGEIVTAINPHQALGMDGPAFHRAREAINGLRERGQFFCLSGPPEFEDACRLSNHVLDLIGEVSRPWKTNRWFVLSGLMRGEDVQTIHRQLRISPVAVYKNVHAGMLAPMLGIFRELAKVLPKALVP